MHKFDKKYFREHRIEFYKDRDHKIMYKYKRIIRSKYHTLRIHIDSMGLIKGFIRHALDHMELYNFIIENYMKEHELFNICYH